MSDSADLDQLRVFSIEDADEDLAIENTATAENRPELGTVLDNLERGERSFADLHGFSDLDSTGLAELSVRWESVDPALRATVVHEVDDISVDDVLIDFSRFFIFAAGDSDPGVRQRAVAALGHFHIAKAEAVLLDILEHDSSDDVRAEAAKSLSVHAWSAAMDELEPDFAGRIEATLFRVAEDEAESWHIRRRAAESVAIYGPSERVAALIRRMWEEDELGLRVSALFAAGRGNQREWIPTVMDALEDEDPEIRMEAVRATGQFGDADALPRLSEVARAEEDVDVRHEAIFAIGQFGTSAASNILRRLAAIAPEADHEVIAMSLTESDLLSGNLDLEFELDDFAGFADDTDPPDPS